MFFILSVTWHSGPTMYYCTVAAKQLTCLCFNTPSDSELWTFQRNLWTALLKTSFKLSPCTFPQLVPEPLRSYWIISILLLQDSFPNIWTSLCCPSSILFHSLKFLFQNPAQNSVSLLAFHLPSPQRADHNFSGLLLDSDVHCIRNSCVHFCVQLDTNPMKGRAPVFSFLYSKC